MPLPNLKQALLLDAASAAAFVVLCLGLTDTLSRLTGLSPTILMVAGWICVPSALLFVHQAFRPSRGLLTMVVAGNAAWVLASLVVWLTRFGELTAIGHAAIIGQAVAVEAFLLLEWRGLKALGGRESLA